MVSVGTIVWLSSELMFFAALFAMYFTIRSVQGAEEWAERTEVLNLPYAATFTVILVASSVTCQLGVFAAERGRRLRPAPLVQHHARHGPIFVLGRSTSTASSSPTRTRRSPRRRTARSST
jgi:heme/copper-type cytochrome/quinol oxidase subunit 3